MEQCHRRGCFSLAGWLGWLWLLECRQDRLAAWLDVLVCLGWFCGLCGLCGLHGGSGRLPGCLPGLLRLQLLLCRGLPADLRSGPVASLHGVPVRIVLDPGVPDAAVEDVLLGEAYLALPRAELRHVPRLLRIDALALLVLPVRVGLHRGLVHADLRGERRDAVCERPDGFGGMLRKRGERAAALDAHVDPAELAGELAEQLERVHVVMLRYVDRGVDVRQGGCGPVHGGRGHGHVRFIVQRLPDGLRIQLGKAGGIELRIVPDGIPRIVCGVEYRIPRQLAVERRNRIVHLLHGMHGGYGGERHGDPVRVLGHEPLGRDLYLEDVPVRAQGALCVLVDEHAHGDAVLRREGVELVLAAEIQYALQGEVVELDHLPVRLVIAPHADVREAAVEAHA